MKKPIRIDQFQQYRYLSQATMNHRGDRCVFVLSQSHPETNSYHHDLVMMNMESREIRPLTQSHDIRSFLFEDDDHLLFPCDRENEDRKAEERGRSQTTYYRLDLTGGEALKAFTLQGKVKSLEKLQDGSLLALISKDLYAIPTEGLEGEALEKALAEIKEEEDYEVIDELPFWFNNRGFINKKRTWAVLIDPDSGEQTVLSGKYMDVHQCEASADGKKIVIAGPEFESVNPQTSTVYLYDRETGKAEHLNIGSQWHVGMLGWWDDQLYMTATDQKTWGTSENELLFVVDPKTAQMCCLNDEDLSWGSSVGSDSRLYGGRTWKVSDHRLWTTMTVENHSELVSFDKEGKMTREIVDEGSVDFFDIAAERIVFAGMREMQLQELYELKEGKITQLTSFNQAVLQDHYVAAPQKLSFINDGIRIDGWVLKPQQVEEGKKYPAILDIHGGPKGVYGEVFMHEMQYWAGQGYFVFFCNPRGSDGRGNAFMDLVGKYGTVDYSDLMMFTDKVLEAYPMIDRKKVAVTGGSYGGFMTNWIIGHTDRFVCAASQRSISNWFSKSLTTDIGYYHNMSQMDSTPWTDPEKMWSFSPLKYADKAVTPTLFIHSDQDYRCWMAEGIQMFQALKLHGVESRICLFHGENHELSRSGKPSHRLRRLKEMTQWFDQYTDHISEITHDEE